MKILGLSCSPRKRGNTEILLDEALKGAGQEGAEVELYSVRGKNINPCDGCETCYKTAKCPIKDDMQPLYEKMLAADGIIYGSPVYFYSMTAQAKTILDRTIPLTHPERSLANKVGGVIVTGASLGVADALKDFYFYMVTRQMLPANFVAAYPIGKGNVINMKKAMKAAFDLGQQVVKIAEKKFEYPRQFGRSSFAYGTHTH